MIYKTIEDINTGRELISPPGDTLLETITIKKITQTELAQRMGRPIKTINEIIMGKASIMPDTAVQFERVLGIKASFWLERERLYRLTLAELDEAEQFIKSKEWIGEFPLSKMMKLNWIHFDNDIVSKTKALLSFFSVANQESYKEVYSKYLSPTFFRISAKDTKDSNAIISWLRRGDIQAELMQAPIYNSKSFKNALHQIKRLMVEQPPDFFQLLQNTCLTCGVKVVHTQCLPLTPISGATRWHNNNPLIQLTGRYKRNDIFWFTFFHEVAHILLHGKKDIFIEGVDSSSELMIKEKEADDFAVAWTLTEEQENEIVRTSSWNVSQLSEYARKFKTNEAIIIGRLAKHNYIHHSVGWEHGFYHNIELDV